MNNDFKVRHPSDLFFLFYFPTVNQKNDTDSKKYATLYT